MVIPQGLSFALVANVEPVVGLYVAMVTAFVYFFLGSSRYLIVGPTAVLSLLVGGFTKQGGAPELFLRDALLLSFLSGIILIILSFLRLGFLTNLLSKPISVGFTAGAAILISIGQIKNIFGIKMETPETVIALIKECIELAKHHTKVNGWSILIFAIAFAYIMILKQIKYTKLVPGPLFALVMGTAASWGFDLPFYAGIGVVGDVPKGFPTPTIPVTSFDDILRALPFSAIVAFLCFVESFTISKPLAVKDGQNLQANQELFALGMANFVGSFFSSFPAAGSFTRTAVNHSVGAKSAFSGLVQSLIVLISVMFLTPTLKYLPYSILAAIVMSGVIGLFEVHEAIYIWKTKKQDFVVMVCSFVFTLVLGVDNGVLAAILLHILLMVVATIRMRVEELVDAGDGFYVRADEDTETQKIPGVIVAKVTDSLIYLNIESFMKQVEDMLKQHGLLQARLDDNGNSVNGEIQAPPPTMMPEDDIPVDEEEHPAVPLLDDQAQPAPLTLEKRATHDSDSTEELDPIKKHPHGIIFDFAMVNAVDASSMMRLVELRKTLAQEGYSMHFAHVHNYVLSVMSKGKFLDEIGPNGIFLSLSEAISTLVREKGKDRYIF